MDPMLTLTLLQAASILYNVTSDDIEKYPDCRRDLQHVLQGVQGGELWAYKMVDSSTKVPNGILTGNLIDYGNFDECLAVRSPNSTLKGQHCMANIKARLNSSVDTTLPLSWSYCVPSSCPGTVVQDLLNNYLPLVLPFNSTAELHDSDCQTEEPPYLSPLSVAGIAVCGVFGLLALVSTLYDVWPKSSPSRQWPASFSLYTNGKKLLSVPTQTGAANLTPLHGLRFLSICWVILGHRYYFSTFASVMNTVDYTKVMDKVEFQLIAGGGLAVDTFLLLSGFLNTFHLLQTLDRGKGFPIIKYYVHRYVRTTPVLAVMVLVYASWFSDLGSGPNWHKMTDVGRDLCLNNWWPTLLYISNYYNPVSQCAGQSWYLAVDMQLYWLSPLVVLPIRNKRKLKWAVLVFLLTMSTITQFVIAFVYKFRMQFTVSLDVEEQKRVTQLIYTPTHVRATPYIIGIAVGFLVQEKRLYEKTISISKGLVYLLWLLSTGCCLGVILGNQPFFTSEENHPYNRVESSFYIAFHRIFWSAGISWIILACLSGYGYFVNSILSWKALVPFSRLTYCVYLCHMAVQQYQLGTIRTTNYYQDFDEVHRYMGDLVMSLGIAVGLSLLFESPVLVIEKLLLSPSAPKKGNDNQAFVQDVEKL